MRIIGCFATSLLMTLIGLPAAVQAQGDTPPPVITVSAKAIAADGSGGASASGPRDFIIGRHQTQYLYVGNVAHDAAAFCSAGGAEDGVKSLDALVADYSHVWQITTTAVKESDGRLVFDLNWQRYSHARGPRPVASGRQQLALAEGQRYILDLLHAPAGARCAAVVLDVEVRLREDPALADEAVQYDLWLVHTDPSGRKQTRHAVLTGLHGARIPFGFGAFRFEVPRLDATQYDFEVTTRITGEIRGRLAAEGTIALELFTTRRDALDRRGQAPGGIGNGSGRKVLSVKPGEAVEIELPSRSGTMGSILSDQSAAEARKSTVTMGFVARGAGGSASPATQPTLISGGRYYVNFQPFFEGHRVTLIVQARKVE